MATCKKNMRNAKPKTPSVEALIRATIIDLKRIASNSKGKMKYLEDLDAVLEEIYGVKHIGSRFCSGKKQAIDKVISKIDFKSLVLMLKGSERGTKGLLAAIVAVHSKLDTDLSKTAKELKKDRKTITEACKRLRKVYHIEKYRDPSNISASDLKSYLDQSDDWYDYDYGYDDDEYSYDDDYGFEEPKIELSSGTSAIEKLFDSYKGSKQRAYDRYDDDDDASYCDCGCDDDDDDDDIRASSGDIANERIDALINKVINPMITKIDNSQKCVASIDEKLDRLMNTPQQARSNYVPIPQESVSSVRPDPQLNAISKALNSINAKVGRTDDRLTKLSSEFDVMNEVVRGLVNDIYVDDDEADDDMDDDGSENVSMDEINAALTGAPESGISDGFHNPEGYNDTASPISLKNS